MSKKLPFFCWYPADFDVDENVKLMNIEQVGLYALCLNHSWVNGSLPADPLEIARAMKVPKGQFLRAWARVVPCFQKREDGRWVNPRQELERRQASERHEAKKKGGEKTAAKRWGSNLVSDSLATTRAYGSDYDSGSVDGSSGLQKSALAFDAAAFDLESAWLEFHALYPPKGQSRQVDARSYYLDMLITAGHLAESRHVEIMRLMRERWLPSDKWAKGFVMREDEFIRQESWAETPERSPQYAARMSRQAGADREKQAFEADYAAWLPEHPGKSQEDFVDWRLEQEHGPQALAEMKAHQSQGANV